MWFTIAQVVTFKKLAICHSPIAEHILFFATPVYLLLQQPRINYTLTHELLLQTLCSYFNVVNVVLDLPPFRIIPDEGQSKFSSQMA